MSELKDGIRKMNWAAEIETFAGPFEGNRKGWLSTAARRAGLTYRQVKALYYGETRDPKHSVATRVLSAAGQARIEKAKRDARQVAALCKVHADRLARQDEDFYRHDIDGLERAARLLGASDSTGNPGADR